MSQVGSKIVVWDNPKEKVIDGGLVISVTDHVLDVGEIVNVSYFGKMKVYDIVWKKYDAKNTLSEFELLAIKEMQIMPKEVYLDSRSDIKAHADAYLSPKI